VALWADMRVASETAVFGVFCRRFGVPMSDGTPTRLPRVVGEGVALDMLLTGRPVHAAEALRIGLANRVVPAGEALAEAIKLAHQIAGFPPLAVKADRQAALEAFDQPEPVALVNEAEGAAAAKAEEAQAGATRFAAGTGRHGKQET
jgi:enoyl-CoA hydratase